MEISDLQIGDYVCFCTEEKGYHNCKVCGIFNNLVRVIFGNEETIVSINDIKPIPLTKRTLRTIGFRYGRTTANEFGYNTPNLKSWMAGCPRVSKDTFERLRE